MPDNLRRRGPEDPQRININQPYEVAYWMARFRITEQLLRRAVAEAGPMVADVKRWLDTYNRFGYG